MKDWTYENEQWTRLPTYLKHLPLFTRSIDWTSMIFRFAWSVYLKLVFSSYIQLRIKGDSYENLYAKYPRLLIISNHGSHLDATSIAASIPSKYWLNLYITAAKDYFFSNPFFTFFSKHCLGAIPLDRKDRKGEAVNLIIKLLTRLDRIWMILFPEGTRTPDGKIHEFKRGISIFAEKTNTPILFLYLDGNTKLWPKGRAWAKPGKLTIHVGPVHQPMPVEPLYQLYKNWVKTINPIAFADDDQLPQSVELNNNRPLP
jgi:1-acyl-sn-glycerol-3-phosphate acyltransferase